MKKKIIAISFIAVFIFAVVWLIIEGSRQEILPIGSRLPKIDYTTLNGNETLTTNNKNKTLIIFFSKECPHCKYELNILNENIYKLIGSRIYLFTSEKGYLQSEDIKMNASLLSSDNVTYGIVNEKEYYSSFGSLATPSLFFFNTEGNLTAKLKGETKFERILKETNKQ